MEGTRSGYAREQEFTSDKLGIENGSEFCEFDVWRIENRSITSPNFDVPDFHFFSPVRVTGASGARAPRNSGRFLKKQRSPLSPKCIIGLKDCWLADFRFNIDRISMKIRTLKRYLLLKTFITELSPVLGPTATAARLGVTRKFVTYTYEKSWNPDFHPGTIGGPRRNLLDADTRAAVELLLWFEVRANPVRRCSEFAASLNAAGILQINRKRVARVFETWRFSSKKAHWRSRSKFRVTNIPHYMAFKP